MAWIDEHWTHYDWDWDVSSYIYDRILPHVTATFGYQAASANTYNDHPTRWGLDHRSVDFWSPSGRGYDIDYWVGEEIKNFVVNDLNPPWIRWYIWQGWMWDYYLGYVWYPYIDPWDQHFDHVHFTFFA